MFENISQHCGQPLTAFNKTALEKFQEMARAYVAAAFKDKNQVWVARNSDQGKESKRK